MANAWPPIDSWQAFQAYRQHALGQTQPDVKSYQLLAELAMPKALRQDRHNRAKLVDHIRYLFRLSGDDPTGLPRDICVMALFEVLPTVLGDDDFDGLITEVTSDSVSAVPEFVDDVLEFEQHSMYLLGLKRKSAIPTRILHKALTGKDVHEYEWPRLESGKVPDDAWLEDLEPEQQWPVFADSVQE